MKKKNIINLIRCYSEKNDSGFRNEAYNIARFFDNSGDYQLAEYIMMLMSDTNTFVPQIDELSNSFFSKLECNTIPLKLPEVISKDIRGIINAVKNDMGVNRFLFEGKPGTGKTETVRQLARILDIPSYSISFENIIDSKLGQTSKNLAMLFDEIRNYRDSKFLVLFDEIDALAIDRINSNDLREMGRLTSSLLKELDKLNDNVILIATTNLFNVFDKALIRRFDKVINFDRYNREDLIEISQTILDDAVRKFKTIESDKRLFRKILSLASDVPHPGDMKNIIKSAIAFSNVEIKKDYFSELLLTILKYNKIPSIQELNDIGFTLREIEVLKGVSRSKASRVLRGEYPNE